MARIHARKARPSFREIRLSLYPVSSLKKNIPIKEESQKKTSLESERRDWKCATCPVCLEFPHNAVLLLCSSHDKGCRPYMCGTSYHFSNCLEQFKKAYAEKTPSHHELVVENRSQCWPAWKKSEARQLKCPLCRGQVKGWTVVEPARSFLNKKKRGCVQDNCSFIGNYKLLRKHVRAQHPSAKRPVVDPVLEQKWKILESRQEREDVISTIRSSMPHAVVLGDYVIDMDGSESDMGYDDEFDDLFESNRSNQRFAHVVLEALRRRSSRNQVRSASHDPALIRHHTTSSIIHRGAQGLRRRSPRPAFRAPAFRLL